MSENITWYDCVCKSCGVEFQSSLNGNSICGLCRGSAEHSVAPDMVNHPPHYTDGGIETADYIEAKKLNWQRGNAVKYISRAGKKGDAEKEREDIRKAIWYLERDLKRMEREKSG